MTEIADPGERDATGPSVALYDRAVESLLDVPVTDEWVDTGNGRTHLLTAGDSTAPPVVVFQGGNITNPATLAWVQGLADDYYLLAPDTPGQPGKTTAGTPAEYGPWVEAVLDGMELDSAAMVGVSHGAGVLLEAAVHAPARVDAAALVVPAGFGTRPSPALARVVALSLAYRLLPRRVLLQRALAPLFTRPMSSVDEVTIETVGQALRTADLAAEFPGPDDLSDLSAFEAPTLVVTAERDPFFPGVRTCKRATRALPSLVECRMLADERHFLSPAGQHTVTDRIRTLLDEHVDTVD